MKTKVVIVVTVLILLGGFVIARTETHRWHRGFGHRGWHHGPVGYVARELRLTDTQTQQIRAIWERERPAVSELAKQFADENRAMSAATAKGIVDDTEVSRIANLQGATLAQLILEKERLKAKIYAEVLSQEQRDRANVLLARWQSHIDQLGH